MSIVYCGNCTKMSLGESPGQCSHCGRDEITTLSDKEVMMEINSLETKLERAKKDKILTFNKKER